MSRLVDICRQSIVYDELSGVATCLRVILSDPEVQVLRVKNRLDSAFCSRESAGYRDLAINLLVHCLLSSGVHIIMLMQKCKRFVTYVACSI